MNKKSATLETTEIRLWIFFYPLLILQQKSFVFTYSSKLLNTLPVREMNLFLAYIVLLAFA